jgi:1-acyl-sn-glycerol-3-phosphate acyltransferase
MTTTYRSHTYPDQDTQLRYDGWSLDARDPKAIEAWMPIWAWFYEHYFRVRTDGWQYLPQQGKSLLIGSHNGGLAAPDMFMFMYDWFRRFGAERLAYGLMHPGVWQASPAMGKLAAQIGAVVAHPKMAIAALRQNATVLIYPGGPEDIFRDYSLRHKIVFAERRGFIKLALHEGLPIIPLISHGAHETLIVLGNYYEQVQQQLDRWGMSWPFGFDPVVFPIFLGLPWGVGIGPIPNLPFPKQIHNRICAPIEFERYGRQAARDRDYVDACYLKVCRQMQWELDQLVAEYKSSSP